LFILICRLAPGHVTEEKEKATKRCLVFNDCHIFCCNEIIYISRLLYRYLL